MVRPDLFVAVPGAALAYWLELGRASPAATESVSAPDVSWPAATPPDTPPAVTGLPDHLVATALCLQMEDHHVRVHRHAHSSLHFAAMRDVVRQIGEHRGLHVHRSWWVAHGAVEAAEEDGRAVTLLLRNGVRVPVARSRVPLLREQGWLDAARGPRLDA